MKVNHRDAGDIDLRLDLVDRQSAVCGPPTATARCKRGDEADAVELKFRSLYRREERWQIDGRLQEQTADIQQPLVDRRTGKPSDRRSHPLNFDRSGKPVSRDVRIRRSDAPTIGSSARLSQTGCTYSSSFPGCNADRGQSFAGSEPLPASCGDGEWDTLISAERLNWRRKSREQEL